MTEKKLKRILREYPFLIDDTFVRSYSEASAISNSFDYPIERFIERAKERSSFPPEAWAGFESAIYQNKHKEEHRQISWIPLRLPVRLLVAIFIAIILLTAFFTLTKPGVALAQTIYRIVVQLIDGNLTAKQIGIGPELSPIDLAQVSDYFDTIEDAAVAIPRPLAYYVGSDAKLLKVYTIKSDGVFLVLNSDYDKAGLRFNISQTFFFQDNEWGAAVNSNDQAIEKTLSDGSVIYIGRMQDGTSYATAYTPEYLLKITSDKATQDEMLQIINKIDFMDY